MSGHARNRSWTDRLRKSPHLVAAAVLVAVAVPISFAGPANAAAGAGDLTTFPAANTVIDQGGPNDVNSNQVDLTQMGNDPAHSPYRLFWSWADTTWTGNNTGNACALLDNNGDGKVDQSVCAIVGNGAGAPGTSAVQVGTPTLYDCNNHFSDRCGTPSVVAGASIEGGVVGSSPLDATGNLITNTDPWTPNGPNTSIEVDIDQAHLTAKQLINVCTYPSAGNGGNNNPFDCIVDLGSSIGLTKTASSNNVNVGDPVTYTLVATNTGISVLNNVSITDTGFTPAPALTCKINNTGNTVTPPVTLQPGDTLNCTFVHTFTSVPPGGSFTNTAKTQGTDSTGKTVTAQDSAVVNVAAARTGTITVTKTVTGPKPAGLGNFDFSVTCGANPATTFSMPDGGSHNVTAIPNGTSCSVTETGKQSANSTTYTLDSGGGPAAYTEGSNFTVNANTVYTVAVTNHYNGGTVHVTKTVTGAPPAGLAAFDIDVTCGGNTTHLHVAGGGSADVTGIAGGTSCSATEVNAQGASSTSYTLDGAAYTAATSFNVANNQTRNVAVTNNYTAIIPPPPTPVLTPNLTLSKSSVPPSGSTVKPGDTITYTLSYANTGTGPANTVITSDVLPAGVTFTSAANGGTYDAATNTVSWALGNLAAGASGTVSFVVTVASNVTQGQTITNVGSIAGTGVAPVQSNPDTVTVDIPATPTLGIVKKVNTAVAEYGDTLTYTLTVTAGGADQTGVVATDQVPAGTEYVPASATCSTGCTGTESAGVVTWSIGSMAAGDTVTLTFQVTITRPTPDANGGIPPETVTNVSTVASDQVDPADSNQVSTQVVAVLGEKNVVPPNKPTPKPQPSPLPFTGMPVPLLQTVVLSSLMIVAGLWLTRPRRRRPTA